MTSKRSGGIPPHIRSRLALDGTWRDGLKRGRPSPRHCPSCGRAVLAAIDPDITNRLQVLEPVPTTVAGELAALLAGGETFTLLPRNELEYRTWREIEAYRPNEWPVLVPHRCGKVSPVEVDMMKRMYPRKIETASEPPF